VGEKATACKRHGDRCLLVSAGCVRSHQPRVHGGRTAAPADRRNAGFSPNIAYSDGLPRIEGCEGLRPVTCERSLWASKLEIVMWGRLPRRPRRFEVGVGVRVHMAHTSQLGSQGCPSDPSSSLRAPLPRYSIALTSVPGGQHSWIWQCCPADCQFRYNGVRLDVVFIRRYARRLGRCREGSKALHTHSRCQSLTSSTNESSFRTALSSYMCFVTFASLRVRVVRSILWPLL
jgi:hypothetical protein